MIKLTYKKLKKLKNKINKINKKCKKHKKYKNKKNNKKYLQEIISKIIIYKRNKCLLKIFKFIKNS